MISRRKALMVSFFMLPLAGKAAWAEEADPLIPLYTPELGRSLEPALFPFSAEYAKGQTSLVFIATGHEWGQQTRTAQLIRQKVETFRPRLIIIEGVASARGPSPADIVQILRTPNGVTSDPNAAEGRVAAETALRNNIPFQGGEPSQAAVFRQLVSNGFSPEDVQAADMLKVVPSLIGSGALSGTGDDRFATAYAEAAARLAMETDTAPLSLSAFQTRYRQVFGVSPEADKLLARRGAPDDTNIFGRINQAQTRLRDQAVLQVIRSALSEYGRVLVVYGGSHWTTQSAALAQLMGRPVFDVHLSTSDPVKVPS